MDTFLANLDGMAIPDSSRGFFVYPGILERSISSRNVHDVHHSFVQCDPLRVSDGDSTLFLLRGIIGLGLHILRITTFSIPVVSGQFFCSDGSR